VGERADKPRGDPTEPSVSIHLRLPPREYNALYERAERARITLPELLRRQLRRADRAER
jgi:hypothetical protein